MHSCECAELLGDTLALGCHGSDAEATCGAVWEWWNQSRLSQSYQQCFLLTDFFLKHSVAVMTVRELFEFVTDPSITSENMDAYLSKVRPAEEGKAAAGGGMWVWLLWGTCSCSVSFLTASPGLFLLISQMDSQSSSKTARGKS